MVSRWIRPDLWAVAGVTLLLFALVLLRFASVTDFLYHGLIKDPTRTAPAGDVIVAPADGYVLYVSPFSDGKLPDIRKKNASISVQDFVKGSPSYLIRQGFQIGIYMQTHGVHINRVPDDGVLIQQIVYNGPHLNMTRAEQTIILTEMLPGMTSVRKLLGLSPYDISSSTDYVYESAREERFTDRLLAVAAELHRFETLVVIQPELPGGDGAFTERQRRLFERELERLGIREVVVLGSAQK